VDCEAEHTAAHPNNHVFDVVLVSEHSAPKNLLIGTKVELLNLKQNIMLNGRTATVKCVSPGSSLDEDATYDLELCEPFEVPPAGGGDSRNLLQRTAAGCMQKIRTGVAEKSDGGTTQPPPEMKKMVPGIVTHKLEAVSSSYIQLATTSNEEILELLEATEVEHREGWVML
jgi:hypothetical protein